MTRVSPPTPPGRKCWSQRLLCLWGRKERWGGGEENVSKRARRENIADNVDSNNWEDGTLVNPKKWHNAEGKGKQGWRKTQRRWKVLKLCWRARPATAPAGDRRTAQLCFSSRSAEEGAGYMTPCWAANNSNPSNYGQGNHAANAGKTHEEDQFVRLAMQKKISVKEFFFEKKNGFCTITSPTRASLRKICLLKIRHLLPCSPPANKRCFYEGKGDELPWEWAKIMGEQYIVSASSCSFIFLFCSRKSGNILAFLAEPTQIKILFLTSDPLSFGFWWFEHQSFRWVTGKHAAWPEIVLVANARENKTVRPQNSDAGTSFLDSNILFFLLLQNYFCERRGGGCDICMPLPFLLLQRSTSTLLLHDLTSRHVRRISHDVWHVRTPWGIFSSKRTWKLHVGPTGVHVV